jgi:hypothetical protein
MQNDIRRPQTSGQRQSNAFHLAVVVVRLMADLCRQMDQPLVKPPRKHYFPVPPQVGQVIFPIPEHLGHSFPFTFLLPPQIGHRIVLEPLQDLQ